MMIERINSSLRIYQAIKIGSRPETFLGTAFKGPGPGKEILIPRPFLDKGVLEYRMNIDIYRELLYLTIIEESRARVMKPFIVTSKKIQQDMVFYQNVFIIRKCRPIPGGQSSK